MLSSRQDIVSLSKSKNERHVPFCPADFVAVAGSSELTDECTNAKMGMVQRKNVEMIIIHLSFNSTLYINDALTVYSILSAMV